MPHSRTHLMAISDSTGSQISDCSCENRSSRELLYIRNLCWSASDRTYHHCAWQIKHSKSKKYFIYFANTQCECVLLVLLLVFLCGDGDVSLSPSKPVGVPDRFSRTDDRTHAGLAITAIAYRHHHSTVHTECMLLLWRPRANRCLPASVCLT